MLKKLPASLRQFAYLITDVYKVLVVFFTVSNEIFLIVCFMLFMGKF